ncbi:thiopurine S-methyltransferase [Acetobacter estunensis]|uniref:thiopurine S-methyltransferase n=1 Tax=Acetobacter estunensis TaxID=104097 RepID=UPI001C2DEAB4|nr:thiopurine S-methyltransferase [Acetobacter estunensis]MBV1836491.1 thiopurine S-methyltransferase [Acetobacter estunensis]
MDTTFWLDKWDRRETGFHEISPNPLLTENLSVLNLKPGASVFVPLCGKTLDIGWLRSQGYAVVGVELSPFAVLELFEDLHLTPHTTKAGVLTCHAAPGLRIFEGNIFDLDADMLGKVAATWDRAALVALPKEVRAHYAAHVTALTGDAPQLLVTLDYDQQQVSGPPFAVSGDEVKTLYGTAYRVSEVVSRPTSVKGKCPGTESLWHLSPVFGS